MTTQSKKVKIKKQYIKAIRTYQQTRALAEDILDNEEFEDINREWEVD